jgi:hypothetical protein
VAATGVLGTLVSAPILFVDASTGALSTVYPNPIYLALTPLESADGAVQVIDPDKLDVLAAQGVEGARVAMGGAPRLVSQDNVTAEEQAKRDAQNLRLRALETEYESVCKVRNRARKLYQTCKDLRAEIRDAKSGF